MELSISHLTKRYPHKVALEDFSFQMQEGIYGLLGANGAGKSTLMNLITDNICRDSGEICYNGTDILKLGNQYRKHIGYMCQQQGEYPNFSAYSFLLYMAELKGIPKKEAKKQSRFLLEKMNLQDVAGEKINGFSGGMKQRVLLAQALLGNPDILLLDEPTAGLDPQERIRIRNFISELSANKIILLATHVVSDIACIADQVLLLKEGKVVTKGTPQELIASLEGKVWERGCGKEEIHSLQMQYPTGNVVQKKEGLAFRVNADCMQTPFIPVTEGIDLEDVYLYYIGNS